MLGCLVLVCRYFDGSYDAAQAAIAAASGGQRRELGEEVKEEMSGFSDAGRTGESNGASEGSSDEAASADVRSALVVSGSVGFFNFTYNVTSDDDGVLDLDMVGQKPRTTYHVQNRVVFNVVARL